MVAYTFLTRKMAYDPRTTTAAHSSGRSCKWQEATDRAVSDESDYDVEFRILLPDGTVKYIHTVGHPVLTKSGDFGGIVGSSTISPAKGGRVLLAGENRLLEMIARAILRAVILDALCRLVGRVVSGSLSSILLVDPIANVSAWSCAQLAKPLQ